MPENHEPRRRRTWKKPVADDGFDEICILIRALEKNQRAAAKRRALDWLPLGPKFAAKRAVLEKLVARVNWKSGDTFPKFRTLVTDTGYSRSSVIFCVNWLRDNGYVLRKPRWNIEGGDQASNVYTIPAMIAQPVPRSRAEPVAGCEGADETDLGHQMHGGSPEFALPSPAHCTTGSSPLDYPGVQSTELLEPVEGSTSLNEPSETNQTSAAPIASPELRRQIGETTRRSGLSVKGAAIRGGRAA